MKLYDGGRRAQPAAGPYLLAGEGRAAARSSCRSIWPARSTGPRGVRAAQPLAALAGSGARRRHGCWLRPWRSAAVSKRCIPNRPCSAARRRTRPRSRCGTAGSSFGLFASVSAVFRHSHPAMAELEEQVSNGRRPIASRSMTISGCWSCSSRQRLRLGADADGGGYHGRHRHRLHEAPPLPLPEDFADPRWHSALSAAQAGRHDARNDLFFCWFCWRRPQRRRASSG